MDRNEAIKAIKAALKKRSGKTWSVTGGKGTAWGWISIDAPPARRKWKYVQTRTGTPPSPGAIYRGVSNITPHYLIEDGSVTDLDSDPWAREAIQKGYEVIFTWEVEDPTCEYGHTSPAERAELAELLGLERVHHQGHSVPASSSHRLEYVARAKGETPTVFGEQYWD